ncbi:DUF2207 domain-containing protein [Saccharibacillus sacchari]|uniref:DUF2207 domain-containing protein n=1 Tax=Saccharibacillus sacchari TaxID=456493 RepID=UPI0004AF9853|nr:DUF2207 domain-containing protein [Saccharibacillus sacchari]
MKLLGISQTTLAQGHWAPALGAGLLGLLLVVAVLRIAVFAVSLSKKGSLSDEEVEALDPLLLAYVYRKSRLKRRHTTVGLLSLVRRGVLSMRRVPAKPRYIQAEDAPNLTFEFRFEDPHAWLTEDERLLKDRLFDDYGSGRKFRLDAIAGPAGPQDGLAERALYRKKKRRLNREFRAWFAEVAKRDGIEQTVRRSIPLRLFVWGFAICFAGSGIGLYAAAGETNSDALVWNVLTVVFAAAACVRVRSRTLFALAALFASAAVSVVFYPDPEGVAALGIAFLYAVPVRLLLPAFAVRPAARDLWLSVRRWRRTSHSWSERAAASGNDGAARMEQALQTAIALDVLQRFAYPFRGSDRYGAPDDRQYPLLALMTEQAGGANDFGELMHPYQWSDLIIIVPQNKRKDRLLRRNSARQHS